MAHGALWEYAMLVVAEKCRNIQIHAFPLGKIDFLISKTSIFYEFRFNHWRSYGNFFETHLYSSTISDVSPSLFAALCKQKLTKGKQDYDGCLMFNVAFKMS